jgi:hypothetical protein
MKCATFWVEAIRFWVRRLLLSSLSFVRNAG